MYKMGDYTWLDLLADSGGFSDPQTQLDFFDLVVEQDRRAQEELHQLATDVAGFEKALDQRRQEALDVRADIDAERILMSQRIAERRALLRDLVQEDPEDRRRPAPTGRLASSGRRAPTRRSRGRRPCWPPSALR